MKFMILVKGTYKTEQGFVYEKGVDELFAEMGGFHDEMQKAGILRDADGLKPTSAGWRIKYSGGKKTVVDGPFTETKEIVAGYTIIDVKSREEALAWTKRYPNPTPNGGDGEIEVRPVYQLEDLAGVPAIREMLEQQKKEGK
jgi:hypothetical protein